MTTSITIMYIIQNIEYGLLINYSVSQHKVWNFSVSPSLKNLKNISSKICKSFFGIKVLFHLARYLPDKGPKNRALVNTGGSDCEACRGFVDPNTQGTRPLRIWILKIQPRSWPTGWTVWVNCYLDFPNS